MTTTIKEIEAEVNLDKDGSIKAAHYFVKCWDALRGILTTRTPGIMLSAAEDVYPLTQAELDHVLLVYTRQGNGLSIKRMTEQYYKMQNDLLDNIINYSKKSYRDKKMLVEYIENLKIPLVELSKEND